MIKEELCTKLQSYIDDPKEFNKEYSKDKSKQEFFNQMLTFMQELDNQDRNDTKLKKALEASRYKDMYEVALENERLRSELKYNDPSEKKQMLTTGTLYLIIICITIVALVKILHG